MKVLSVPLPARSSRLSPLVLDILRCAVMLCSLLLATIVGCLIVILLLGGIPMP